MVVLVANVECVGGGDTILAGWLVMIVTIKNFCGMI